MEENKKQEEFEQEEKLGFFKKFFYSILKFEKYPEMAMEGVARAIKYLIQVMLIFSIIISIGLMYQFGVFVNKAANYLQNDLPNMTYNAGILNVEAEEPIIIERENDVINKVIVDTKTENQEKIDEYINSIEVDKSGIIILKDKAIVKNSAVAGNTTYKYTDLANSLSNEEIESLTKQDIINYLKGKEMYSVYAMFFVIMCVYTLLVYFISTLVDALVLAILGNLTTLFIRIKLKFSAVFSMSIYALTLSLMLNAIYMVVNMFTGFRIEYFQVMYTSIAYIYLVTAMFMIKSDFIKKQQELMQILEEEKIVRQEMKEKEKEEEKKQEEPKDEEEKNDTKKDDDNEEPKGSEA